MLSTSTVSEQPNSDLSGLKSRAHPELCSSGGSSGESLPFPKPDTARASSLHVTLTSCSPILFRFQRLSWFRCTCTDNPGELHCLRISGLVNLIPLHHIVKHIPRFQRLEHRCTPWMWGALLCLPQYPESHTKICTRTFVVELIVTARNWKHPKCPSADGQMNKMWTIFEDWKCKLRCKKNIFSEMWKASFFSQQN